MVNRAVLIGRLGQDPELRYTGGGHAVCNLRVATDRHYRTGEGNKERETTWHRVVVWGNQAEVCKEYLRKGRQVYVEGRIENRSYDDRDGNRRHTSEVVASRVAFLGDRRGDAEPRQAPSFGPEDDIPELGATAP